jgi:Na+(H+)/acetate symporter ActP
MPRGRPSLPRADTDGVSKRSGAVVAVAVVLGGIAAFTFLDVVLAAALVAAIGTLAAIGVLAAGWDSHPTFEERERARARSRKERWEKNADVRARDRARWEAHQARQSEKGRQAEEARGAGQAGRSPSAEHPPS